MTRAVPEWIAKHDDERIPPRVRQRVFDAHGGICAVSGRQIGPGDTWECDHRIALPCGGEHRESNLQPVLSETHREKTRRDVALKSKIRRVRSAHLGIQQTKKKIPYRRFNGDPVWQK